MTGLGRGAARLRCAVGAVAFGLATSGTALAQPADTLRVGNWDFPPGRGNPHSTVVSGTPQIYIWPAIYDTLTSINNKGEASPWLATAWKNIDPLTWQMTLRQGVKFHNGEILTPRTITDMFAWFTSEAGKPSVAAAGMRFVTSVVAIDDKTLEFKTSAPRPIFPNLIAGVMVPPEKAWAELGPEKFVVTPIGSGAYRTTAWTNEGVKLEAFADAWNKPKIPRVEILRLAEQASRLQALLSGQIDVMISTQPDEVKTIQAAGGKVDMAPAPALMQLGFVLENVKAGVDNTMLKDKRVRQALNYAVNKQAINDSLLGGTWRLNSQFSAPHIFGYNHDLKPYEYDPAKAKSLLAEAGYPNGFSIKGEVRSFQDMWGAVAQDLDKVGVKLEFQNVQQAEWLRKFLATSWDYQTFGVELGWGAELDSNRMAFFQSCRKTPQPHYCNKDLMALHDAADVEFDVEKRRKILQELMAKMREDASVIFLYEQVDLVGLTRRVQGFRSVNRNFQYHEMSLAN